MRLIIVAFTSLAIVATCTTIFSLVWSFANESTSVLSASTDTVIHSLAVEVMGQLRGRATLSVQHYFDTLRQVANSQLGALAALNVTNGSVTQQWGILRSLGRNTIVAFPGMWSWTLLLANRDQQSTTNTVVPGPFTYLLFNNTGTPATRKTYALPTDIMDNSEGTLLSTQSGTSFSNQNQPYYARALQRPRNTVGWSGLSFPASMVGDGLIHASFAFCNGGQFVLVGAVSAKLSILTTFLANAVGGTGSVLYLVNATGFLLGSSTGSVMRVSATNTTSALHASESSSALVRGSYASCAVSGAATLEVEPEESAATPAALSSSELRMTERSWWCSTSSINDSLNLGLTLVLVTPRSYFFSEVERSKQVAASKRTSTLRVTLGLCGLVLGIGLLAGLALSVLLTAPLSRIIKQMEFVAEMVLEDAEVPSDGESSPQPLQPADAYAARTGSGDTPESATETPKAKRSREARKRAKARAKPPVPSAVLEIRRIQQQFDNMRIRLREYKAFIPAVAFVRSPVGDPCAGPDFADDGSSSYLSPKNNAAAAGTGAQPQPLPQPRAATSTGRPQLFHDLDDNLGLRKAPHRSPSVSSNRSGHSETTSGFGTAQSVLANLRGITGTGGPLSAGLAHQSAACLFVDIDRFHHRLRTCSPKDVLLLHSLYVTYCSDTIRHTGGAFDGFAGDKLFASWNTFTTSHQHSAAACRAALALQAAVPAITRQIQEVNPSVEPVSLRCGIAQGRVWFGRLGNDTTRGFAVMGPIVNHAFKLLKHCKKCRVRILVDPSTQECAQFGLSFQPVDIVQFEPHSAPAVVFQPLAENEQTTGEWMYVLENQNQQRGQELSSRVFDAVRQREFGRAAALISASADTGENDTPNVPQTPHLAYLSGRVQQMGEWGTALAVPLWSPDEDTSALPIPPHGTATTTAIATSPLHRATPTSSTSPRGSSSGVSFPGASLLTVSMINPQKAPQQTSAV